MRGKCVTFVQRAKIIFPVWKKFSCGFFGDFCEVTTMHLPVVVNCFPLVCPRQFETPQPFFGEEKQQKKIWNRKKKGDRSTKTSVASRRYFFFLLSGKTERHHFWSVNENNDRNSVDLVCYPFFIVLNKPSICACVCQAGYMEKKKHTHTHLKIKFWGFPPWTYTVIYFITHNTHNAGCPCARLFCNNIWNKNILTYTHFTSRVLQLFFDSNDKGVVSR